MNVAEVSRNRVGRLPQDLQIAQDSIELPEVREMLKRLSQYNLGIYMPHMHDEQTGAFRPLPPGITQVEDGLVVSFRPQEECVDQGETSYIAVGWFLNPNAMAGDEEDIDKKMCIKRCRDTVHGHEVYHGKV
jgi:hypothetical protein